MRRHDVLGSVRTEGGLLPADLLTRVAALDGGLSATSPASYHLVEGERINEAINRSWNRLVGVWANFRDTLGRLTPDDRTATNITRSRWSTVLFQELGYGQLQSTKAAEIDGKTYAISHTWGHVPIHLVGARVPLDRRTEGVAGAATMSPHGLVQEFLNRSDDHLWGFVTNGLQLRLLRDNATLTRQAFVEFDVEAIFEGNDYPTFALLWLVCHESRVEGEPPSSCVLETWSNEATKQGTRALEQLRVGVQNAIDSLGTGFLAHPENTALRDALRSGALDKQDYYRELLRLVYRLLFLFVAEDRSLLLDPQADPAVRERYTSYYSLSRIRELASLRRGGPHADLWEQLLVVFTALSRAEGAPALGLRGLGSFLWSPAATPDLDRASLPNRSLLAAVLALTSVQDGKVRRAVDYRNLGSEELGSVYESLLEMHPNLSVDERTFRLATAAGNERKTTGSYYTPTSLINELLDSALEPVLDEAARSTDAEAAILDLKVLDPACGSGHFLIAAAHRIAKRLAAVRTGDAEPSPDATRAALRAVVGRCLHGIDLNPMAVELCKVSLWMEAMEPGKPLGFLDNRIIRGNALIGATPKLLDDGVPDDAFKPLTGDDKAHVTSWKKQNKAAREGQGSLFGGDSGVVVTALAAKADEVERIRDSSLADVEAKAARWSELLSSSEYQAAVHAADTWCAAFVAPKRAGAPVITHAQFRLASTQPDRIEPAVRAAVGEMADQYGFLHWHLAFLDVYGGKGGFDVVLGNPPWDSVQFTEKEFFAERDPLISGMVGSRRKTAIAALESTDSELWMLYRDAVRKTESEDHFLRTCGRFCLTAQGRHFNTYHVFVEAARSALTHRGRAGLIVPTGIATDDNSKEFFASSVKTGQLVSLVDFENRLPLFQRVHRSYRFCLLTLAGSAAHIERVEFEFYNVDPADTTRPTRAFSLSADELLLLSPDSGVCPAFRNTFEADLARRIYRECPSIGLELNLLTRPGLFNLTNDSKLFQTTLDHDRVSIVEGKQIFQFDHRYATFDGNEFRAVELLEKSQPNFMPQSKLFASCSEVARRGRGRTWFLAWREVTNATNERTVVAAIIPNPPAPAHTIVVAELDALTALTLVGLLNSFALDYLARQRTGGSHLLVSIVKQIPIPHLVEPWVALISRRSLELTYTSWSLEGLALEAGVAAPPFVWNEERRAHLLAELNAVAFSAYGIARDDVNYIMDTFPIVRRKDEAAHGEYRTKRLILERYDALAEAIATGTEYQTVLDPPPAHPSLAHPESTRPDWA